MVQQVSLLVPTEIEIGLKTGTLYRTGSVVRDVATGQIVKHLEEIDVAKAADAAKEVGPKALAAIKGNTVATVITSAVITAVFTLAASNAMAKKSQKAAKAAFDEAWQEYIEALLAASLTAETVDNLSSALDALVEANEGKPIELEGDNVAALINAICDYTNRFSEANSSSEEELPAPLTPGDSSLESLRQCLSTQRIIFSKAA